MAGMVALDRSWQLQALCRGNHSYLFFPPSTVERKEERERREQKAKAICAVCPVKPECLEFAVQIREPYGIWGGLTENERRQLIARRAA
ncbi:MAG: WhiB family transcriptional regulator, partial [Acidimicrobiia bacterium]